MSDLLVKLYQLPSYEGELNQLKEQGYNLRRPIAPEKSVILEWVRENFGKGWENECDVAFSRNPISCYVVSKQNEVIGFACYDVTCKAFFGPTGVSETHRGRNIGKVLLIKSLEALRELGYGYGIIGSAGPVAFYQKAVGAIEIMDSSPGIYENFIAPQ